MGNLREYVIQSFSSDLKSFWYSLNDKSYPFFQYRRKVEGSDTPIYENHNFILEFLQAIILIPILIIALLFWNISRALPRGREYANAFPYKVLDLSQGKDRTDYFTNKSSNNTLKEQLLIELRRITNNDAISNPVDFMRNVDIDDLYGRLGVLDNHHIKEKFSALVDSLTRKPSQTFIKKVKYCYSFSDSKVSYDDVSDKVRKNINFASKNINLGGHLWLYFFRHLYRSYFPWEESGLIRSGKVNEIFQVDGTIEDFTDEDGALDTLNLYWSRGDYALQELSKNISDKHANLLSGRVNIPDFTVVKKFAFLWHLVEKVRSKNSRNRGYHVSDHYGESFCVYLENDKETRDLFGTARVPHKESICMSAFRKCNNDMSEYRKIETIDSLLEKSLVNESSSQQRSSKGFFGGFKGKGQTLPKLTPQKFYDAVARTRVSTNGSVSYPYIRQDWFTHHETKDRVDLNSHLTAINTSVNPEDTARDLSPIWLNKNYYFTGDYISKREYIDYVKETYEESTKILENSASWPNKIPKIKMKNDFSDLLKSEPTPISYVILLAIPRLIMALLITASQAIFLLFQLIICAIISLIPFINLYIYRPLSSRVGKCCVGMIGLLFSMLILVNNTVSTFTPVTTISNIFITKLVSFGWSNSAAISLFHLTTFTIFLCSLMLSIYAFKVISMDDFVEKQQDVQLKSMRKSFGISTIILISSSILYACFIYPNLIASEATISSVLSFMSSLSMVGCLSATLVLISVFISMNFFDKNSGKGLGLSGFSNSTGSTSVSLLDGGDESPLPPGLRQTATLGGRNVSSPTMRS